VVIKLAVPVKPKEFVLEHLSKSISIVGHINSAPNNFTVYVSEKNRWGKIGRSLGPTFLIGSSAIMLRSNSLIALTMLFFHLQALRDKNDKEGTVLGRYFYDAESGSSIQRFKPQVRSPFDLLSACSISFF
jgi:hypothetical protein